MVDGVYAIVQMELLGCVATLDHLLSMDFHGLSYRNGPSGAEMLAVGVAVLCCTKALTCL